MGRYTLSVPVMSRNLDNENLENTIAYLKNCDVKRVFIATSCYQYDQCRRDRQLATLERCVGAFRSHGFETGIWVLSSVVQGDAPFPFKADLDGHEIKPWRCHSSEAFLQFSGAYLRDFARLKPDLIMLDDDLHYGHTGAIGCCCKVHRQLFAEKFGPETDFDETARLAFAGKPNRQRQMWQSLMGESQERYAAEMRRAVDSVAPSVRLGFCANRDNFGTEGTDLVRLSKLLAGNTRPFVRLIGAPYWDIFYSERDNLTSVIESTRQQAAELSATGIEIMSEGDVFPRPRTAVPAALLESFDTALQADGNCDGILKYMVSYDAPIEYETGYLRKHLTNKGLYQDIQTYFSDKKAVGVRVYHFPQLYTETDLSFAFAFKKKRYLAQLSGSPAGKLLGQNGIPTTYEGSGTAGIAIGEQARYLDKEALQGGILTDLAGAAALTRQGTDVGLKHIGERFAAGAESFDTRTFHRLGDVSAPGYMETHRIDLAESAVIDSWYITGLPNLEGEYPEMDKVPAAYRYENAAGQRFFVMNTVVTGISELPCKSYGKAEQLANACEWVSGKSLPAFCAGNPDLYLMCKEDANTLSVGLWNFSCDSVTAPRISLAVPIRSVHFIGCTGTVHENTVTLSQMPPYGFCGIVVSR